jgi:hypothetical protein
MKGKRMKSILVIGFLLIASLMFSGQVFADVPYGTATVDGDLSDWAGATWNSFDTVYDSAPIDIAEGAWSARWTPDKVYIAVRVRDTAHVFADSYGANGAAWAERDATELYLHTTGHNADPLDYSYSVFEEPAQQWTIGMKTAADGSVWGTIGYPPGYQAPSTVGVDYVPTVDQLVIAGSINGQWLYYEAAITPLEYFGGLKGNPDVSSPLSAGDTIGLDVTAVSNDGVSSNYNIPGYAGMKCNGALSRTQIGGWSANYSLYAQQVLGPVTYTATVKVDLGDFGGDSTGIPVAVEITGSDNQTRILNTVLNNGSSFSIPDLLPGTYSVAIKPSHWLRYVVSGVQMPAADTSFDIKGLTGFSFINGDVDGDNYIGNSDYDIWASCYDTSFGDAGFDASADIDGDNYIGNSDYDVWAANYDISGD